MTHRRLFRATYRAVALAAALGLLSACGSSSSTGGGSAGGTAAGSGTNYNVKLLEYPSSTSWQSYLGVKEGIFAKNHLNVSLVTLGNGVQATSALAGNSIDIAEFDPLNTVPVASRGLRLQMITGLSTMVWNLILSPSLASYKSRPLADTIAALKGKAVSVPSVGGAGSVLLNYLASAYGIPANSLNLVTDPGDAAFLAGRTQAAMSEDGTDCVLLSNGQRPDVFDFSTSGSYPKPVQPLLGLPEFGYWATSSYVSSHPQLIKDFQAAIAEIDTWATNPANLAKVVSEIQGSSYFLLSNVTRQQVTSCVRQAIKGWTTSFSKANLNTWISLAAKADKLQTSNLPTAASMLAPGAP